MIVVFDALSGSHIPLYGYPRVTTPNLNRLATRATVYHRHYAGGNFTTPGVGTLLTGTYPFTHRAFQTNDQTMPEFAEKNLFRLFPHHYRIAYTHNTVADTLLRQFGDDLQIHKPPADLFLRSNILINKVFSRDNDIANLSWYRVMADNVQHTNNSIFLSHLDEQIYRQQQHRYLKDFPDGLPEVRSGELFLLDHAMDWIVDRLEQSPQPFLGYFHFFPPHNPYHTSRKYHQVFASDGYSPEAKPEHPFSEGMDQEILNDLRNDYDEYILYLDSEFGRLMDTLDSAGLLENTWLIFTSDHGELFERGIWRHTTPTLFEPLVHIPLVISAPGQESRQDIYNPTSAADILPTLLYLSGQIVPNWCEGLPLPPYAQPEPERSIYALEAKGNGKTDPLTQATTMLMQWPWKLTQYSGYENTNFEPYYDLFNLQVDPQETENYYRVDGVLSGNMRRELVNRLAQADAPYIK